MFREIGRIKQKLSTDECIFILENEKRGVLAVNGDDGYPYALPMNHFYCPDDGKIYFHSAAHGHKIDAILRDGKVSYCVYDGGYRNDGEWYLNIRSVIVFGHVEIIEDREKIYEISRKLSYKFTSDSGYIEREIEKSGPKTFMFAIVPEHISGKTVKEK